MVWALLVVVLTSVLARVLASVHVARLLVSEWVKTALVMCFLGASSGLLEPFLRMVVCSEHILWIMFVRLKTLLFGVRSAFWICFDAIAQGLLLGKLVIVMLVDVVSGLACGSGLVPSLGMQSMVRLMLGLKVIMAVVSCVFAFLIRMSMFRVLVIMRVPAIICRVSDIYLSFVDVASGLYRGAGVSIPMTELVVVWMVVAWVVVLLGLVVGRLGLVVSLSNMWGKFVVLRTVARSDVRCVIRLGTMELTLWTVSDLLTACV